MLVKMRAGCPHLREMHNIMEAQESDGSFTDAGVLFSQLLLLEWRAQEAGASPRSLMIISAMRRMADEIAMKPYVDAGFVS